MHIHEYNWLKVIAIGDIPLRLLSLTGVLDYLNNFADYVYFVERSISPGGKSSNHVNLCYGASGINELSIVHDIIAQIDYLSIKCR